jgi:hypothetical protein
MMGEITNVQHMKGSGGAQHFPKVHSKPLGLVDSASMQSLLGQVC